MLAYLHTFCAILKRCTQKSTSEILYQIWNKYPDQEYNLTKNK